MLDVAVLEAVDEQIKIQKLRYKKLDEVPFDFDRRRMSVVVKTPQQKARMITKGAVEEMLKGLPLCQAKWQSRAFNKAT